MASIPKRRLLFLAGLGFACLFAGLGAWFKLTRELRAALGAPAGDAAPVRLVALPGAAGACPAPPARNISDGLVTSSSPASVMRNSPISLVEP